MHHDTELLYKFKGLKAALGLNLWETKGVLQSIWDFTSRECLDGSLDAFDFEELCVAIEWPQERAEELQAALIKWRWIDETSSHGLVVHDWAQHCPSWVKKRAERGGVTLLSGSNRKNGRQRRPSSAAGSQRDTDGTELNGTKINGKVPPGNQRESAADDGGQREPIAPRETNAPNGAPTDEEFEERIKDLSPEVQRIMRRQREADAPLGGQKTP